MSAALPARVRLDPCTGFFDILDCLVTHDTGRAINTKIVDGRIVGAVAGGIGGAMLSEWSMTPEAGR